MISKVSKSLITALLLAVNFNTSHSMHNNMMQSNSDYIIGKVTNLSTKVKQYYNINKSLIQANNQIANLQNIILYWMNKLGNLQQQLGSVNINLENEIKPFCNKLLDSIHNNTITELFNSFYTSWNIIQLNNLNKILQLPQTKNYIEYNIINDEIKNIIPNFIKSIIDHKPNREQLYNIKM